MGKQLDTFFTRVTLHGTKKGVAVLLLPRQTIKNQQIMNTKSIMLRIKESNLILHIHGVLPINKSVKKYGGQQCADGSRQKAGPCAESLPSKLPTK